MWDRTLLAVVVAAVLLPLAAQAAPPANLDARVDELIGRTGVPGAAVAIVEGDKVVVARGYGVRRLGSGERVDDATIFQMGSTTKAMTAAALAVLVDRGRIRWDDRVVDLMPEFQMHDSWVTREMTVRDLLVHNSGLGLGAGDLLFVPRTTFSRDEIVRRLRFIKPSTSFRSGYAYDNVLYIAAGRLIERVSGQTWEAFVRDNLLRPSGMTTATTGNDERFANPNRASPHGRLDGPVRGLGTQVSLDEQASSFSANMAPAGGVSASATDVAGWLRVQLGHGLSASGVRVFSETSAAKMWTPQVLMPVRRLPGALADATPQFSAYGLGWDVRDYRGHKIITHGGAVFGSQAHIVILPDANVAFAIMINSEDSVAMRAVVFELMDHYLGLPPRDWAAAWEGLEKLQVEGALAELKAARTKPAKVGPSLAPARYAGDYADAWYGGMRIRADKGGLTMDFLQSPGMVGRLTHYQYDTFRVDWQDKGIEPAYVTFGLDQEGGVERITMRAVSPLADFSFDYQDLEFRPAPAPP